MPVSFSFISFSTSETKASSAAWNAGVLGSIGIAENVSRPAVGLPPPADVGHRHRPAAEHEVVERALALAGGREIGLQAQQQMLPEQVAQLVRRRHRVAVDLARGAGLAHPALLSQEGDG